ncbi:DUF7619 domain-containing protein [Nonlabens ulvanivorans]|nr:T9SS type A sorting domain-containing protein [Nonlabens ulvanivorans]PRX13439.1 putative repeat protein (TIGR01451 family)/predicted secreted protein (Por secretion system target) [Nonlabens ulvanivorans]
MRKLILAVLLLSSINCFGQIINIPDPAFKNFLRTELLIDTDFNGTLDQDVDLNNDGEIELSEAWQVKALNINNTHGITNLQGIESFVRLTGIQLTDTVITTIPVSTLSDLYRIDLIRNQIISLDAGNLTDLRYITIQDEPQFTSINFPQTATIFGINIRNCPLSTLNFTGPTSVISQLNITDCPITSISSLSNKYIGELTLQNTSLTSLTLDPVASTAYPDVTIMGNSNLTNIDVEGNYGDLNILSNTGLTTLDISNYRISRLIIENNTSLNNLMNSNSEVNILKVKENNFFSLNFDQISGLYDIEINGSFGLRELSIQNLDIFAGVDVTINGQLQRLYMQNTRLDDFEINNNTTLLYICVRDNISDYNKVINELQSQNLNNVVVNSYCSFGAGGVTSEISGALIFDENNDGCDLMDPSFTNLVLNATDGNVSGFISTNADGDYIIPVSDGQHTITPNPENPTYWNFSPPNVVVDFPTQASPFTQDFCVTANGTIEDLEVIVVPLEQARPGFDTDYKVVIKNKGNVTSSGTVTLDYEEDFMTLLSTNPNAGNTPSNQLSWSFSNLQPFQMEEYEFTMTLNTPTATVNPLNGGDIITYTGTVTGTGTDAMPADNVMVFDQTVVNSYDPNDKTCLEGETIDPVDVGEYVHYIIRFENTGTASAINVVVKDEINLNQFDITTLIPLGGSHDYYTRIREGNVVEFIHEDINLDFNNATNDGYVLFKIKTLNTLTVGDTFDNTAEIFFDFNAPIVTNTETVTVMSTASIVEVTDSSIQLYPNPANSFVNITADLGIKSATIVDLNGRTISQTNFTGNESSQRISLENLNSGIYFVTIKSEVGQKVEKLVVQ